MILLLLFLLRLCMMLFSFDRALVLQKSHDVWRREVGLPYDVLKEENSVVCCLIAKATFRRGIRPDCP